MFYKPSEYYAVNATLRPGYTPPANGDVYSRLMYPRISGPEDEGKGVRLEFAQFGHFDSFDVIRAGQSMASLAIEDLPMPLVTGLKTMYYVDSRPLEGENYYIVRMNYNGQSFYSQEIMFRVGGVIVEYVGNSGVYFGSNGWLDVGYPAGLQENDLILLFTSSSETYGHAAAPFAGFTQFPFPSNMTIARPRIFYRWVPAGGLTGRIQDSVSPANNATCIATAWRASNSGFKPVIKHWDTTHYSAQPDQVRNWWDGPTTTYEDSLMEVLVAVSSQSDTNERATNPDEYVTVSNESNRRLGLFYKDANFQESLQVRWPSASTSGIYPSYGIGRCWIGAEEV